MKRSFLLWLLYQPYKWFFLFPFMLLSTFFFSMVAIVVTFFFGQRTGSKVAGTCWARLITWLTPVSVNLSGMERIDPNQSYVIVSNHQSLYDILVLYGWLNIDFKWVIKKELRNFPGLGVGCEKLGHIFIDRSNPQQAIEALKQAKERITKGTSVIFFPEGTRALGTGLKPFKKGAFHMAKDLDLPILPVTILGTRAIHPSKSFDTFPGRATLVVHEPIALKDYHSDVTALMQEARKRVATPLANQAGRQKECSQVSTS